jgi:thiamine biosynthesis lipoprotein
VTPTSSSFPALGTTAVVCVTNAAALADARVALERELSAIDRACSRFRPDSELVRLNAGAGAAIQVGDALFEAIAVALRVAAATQGLVDPTVGRSLRLAGYDRSFEHVRAGRRQRPTFVAAHGWQTVEVDAGPRTVRLPPGVELDLGATAKALAADRSASAIASETGCGVLVSLGGDVAVSGAAPPGGWPIRISDDHAAPLDGPGPVVSISSGGLATSGTAVRRWRAGRTELHHIVDPRTGRPAATPWRTITVAAATCVDANAASTAALVLGENAPAWLAERGLPARLVSETGSASWVCNWPVESAA